MLDGMTITAPLEPLTDFLLINITKTPSTTGGGIILTKAATPKSTTGKVISVGPGRTHGDTGVLIPSAFAAGDNVIYGQYDGTEVKYDGHDHTLIRSGDVLVAFPDAEPITCANVRVVSDRILVKVQDTESSTAGGLLLSTGTKASTKPSVGTVVAVGLGRIASTGHAIPMSVQEGDMIKYRDYAGNEVEIEGEDYTVVDMGSVLAKF